MIQINYLHIQNFMSIKDIELEFTKAGIFFISGYNEVNGGSNGSGKSSILNAIPFALFGRTAKGLSGDAVTLWGSREDAKITLRLGDTAGHNYEITRGPGSFSFSIDGVDTKGHKRDVQTTINDTFGTNYDLFLSSVMFTRGQSDFLTDAGDAAKKRLFKSLLGLERIDKMAEKAKAIYNSLFSDALAQESKLNNIEQHIKEAKIWLEKYHINNTTWENDKSRTIKALQESIQDPPSIDKTLQLELEKLSITHALLCEELQIANKQMPLWQENLSEEYRTNGYHLKKMEELNALIVDTKSIVGTTCSKCGARITKKGIDIHLHELTEEFLQHENKLVECTNKIKVIEQDIILIDNKTKEAAEIVNKIHSLEIMIASQKHQLEIYESKKKQTQERIVAETASSNPYTDLITEKETEIVTLESKLDDSRKKFKELTTTIDVYSYIKWVLSREGVVSVIIEKTFGRLEALINNYLSAMSSEGFQIQIKPQKELKSGALKEEIEILILQEGRKIPYSGLSGGQEQRVVISVLLALYTLSKELGMNRFDFLLLDEVLDLSLDEKGQQDIMRILYNLNDEIRNIFVISHKDGIANDFHFQIDVRRGLDGVTQLHDLVI